MGKKYYAVEVTRTVTERRKIYVCVESGFDALDVAKDAAKEHSDWAPIKTPWELPYTEFDIASAVEVDRPARVDVTA